ncbi:MAG TPA: shikimate kinase [Verrucomicrobiae bacterium]|nr:shikimate kinase [Verrucomicrobiae bacterium]
MESGRQLRNLSLIGFMGTGKSSVGQMAASALQFAFVDTDEMIETRTGTSVTEIFQRHGEPVFRDWESRIVRELAGRSGTVIATGGGLPAENGNLASLKSHSLVVCLWATPEKIYSRVKMQTHRPLLHDPDPLAKIRALLAAREAYYKQADVLLNTEFRSAREVAQQIVHHFRMASVAQSERCD